MTPGERLVSLGMPSPLAREMAKQLKGRGIGGSFSRVPFSDDFNRADAKLEDSPVSSSGGVWEWDGIIPGGIRINRNGIAALTTSTNGTAYRCPDQGSADQYIEVILTAPAGTGGAFVCCRMADRFNFLGFRADGSRFQVYRRVEGEFTRIASVEAGIVDGSILRFEVTGLDSDAVWKGYVDNGLAVEGTIGVDGLNSTRQGVLPRFLNDVLWIRGFIAGELTMPHFTGDDINHFARALLNATTAAAIPPGPEPIPSINPQDAKLSIHDVQLKAGDTVATVPVTLSEPAKVAMAIKIFTVNGTSATPAIEGTHFTRTNFWLQFNPGEDEKLVEVPVASTMDGKEFFLQSNLPQGLWNGSTPVPSTADSRGTIYGVGANPGTPVVPRTVDSVAVALPPIPNLSELIFEEDFTNFQATSSGFLADGVTPCWLSRADFAMNDPNLLAGRELFNGEVTWVADPAVNPGTEPWFVDPIDSVFKIKAEHWPDGVPGATLNEGGTPKWFYSTGWVSTKRLFQMTVGNYLEMRMKLPLVQGMWSAGWMIDDTEHLFAGQYAPFIEFDLIETFFNGGTGLDKWGTTYHHRNSSNTKNAFGNSLEYTGITTDAWHTFGFWWGEDKLVGHLDGVPYFQVPNRTPLTRTGYIIFNAAAGGLAGTPDPLDFPVTMGMEFIRVWK